MECNWRMCKILSVCDVMNESGRDEAECSRKVASGRRVESVARSLVNAKGLQVIVLGSCMKHCLCLFLHMLGRL